MKKILPILMIALIVLSTFSMLDPILKALSDDQLTTDPNDEGQPSWSADGEKIAYLYWTSGWHRYLKVMDDDGTNQAPVDETSVVDNYPAFSPNGEKIAFIRHGFRGDYWDLMIYDTSTGEVTRITDGPPSPGMDEGSYRYPKWSEDGTKLVFHYTEGPTSDNREKWICTMNMADYSVECLNVRGMNPRFCYCDTKIIFNTDDYQSGDNRIALMNADGTDVQTLPGGPRDLWPHMSLLTHCILFTRCYEEGGKDLYVMDKDGSDRRAITNDKTSGNGEWSPDEKYIVYASSKSGNSDIWKMKAPVRAHRRIITVDNSANPNSLSDYQVFCNITYDSDMQSDFDDLRFTWYDEASDEEINIDYWLDKYVDSEYALVWVEVPSIKALGQETLYMYYGDPDATSGSCGEQTFVFFDGFSTDTTANYHLWSPLYQTGNPNEFSWDSNGWLFVNASIREHSGRCSNVHVTHNDAQIDAREEKYWLETRGKAFGTGVLDYFGVGYAYEYPSVPDDDYELFCLVRPNPQIQSKWGTGYSGWEFRESGLVSTGKDKWYRIGLGTSPNGTVIGRFCDDDYNEVETVVNQTVHQDNEWWVDLLASRYGVPGTEISDYTLCSYFDYVRVRKFTDPEPCCSSPEPLSVTVDIDPDTLNLKSLGQWVTAYIQLPEEYNAEDIDVATILLGNTIPPVLDPEYDFVTNSSEYLTDNNEDGWLERMVKFDRAEVSSYIRDYVAVNGWKFCDFTLTVTGELFDDTQFEGCDTIKVIVGDVNGDNAVNIFDLTEVAIAYGSFEVGPEYNWFADITEDGLVDARDLAIVTTNYGKS